MRRFFGAAAVAAAMALLTAVPVLASSNAVLSDTAANPNGTNTPVGNIIHWVLVSGTKATFFATSTGTTGISCTVSSMDWEVLTNPPAPGTATFSVIAWSFSSCTANGGIKTVNSITVDHLPYNASITSGSPPSVTISPGSNGAIHITFKLTTIFGQMLTCGYHVHATSGNLSATASNSNNSIKFTNQQLDGDSGNNGQCVSTLFFSAEYVASDSSNGNAAVFFN
jgi:hypothetical protein